MRLYAAEAGVVVGLKGTLLSAVVLPFSAYLSFEKGGVCSPGLERYTTDGNRRGLLVGVMVGTISRLAGCLDANHDA